MTPLPCDWLFTPGSRPERFDKAARNGALILDLEDAVALADKETARSNVLAWLASDARTSRPVAVRINSLRRTIGLMDLVALAELARGPDLILLPKVEAAGDIQLVAEVLKSAGSGARLMALIESARGVCESSAIAREPMIEALMFGAADYAADLGRPVETFRPDFTRATIVNAAVAAGVAAIDSPFFDLNDDAALLLECNRAVEAGFHGKAAIHPGQLSTIRAAFAPSSEDLAHAEAILAGLSDGVGVLDGRMIDVAMVRWAERVIAGHASVSS